MWGRRESAVIPFLVFFCLRLLQARAQQGLSFISIDCGATANYTDDAGIEWSADVGYTSTGKNAVIDIRNANLAPDSAQNGPKLQTLRYFPGPVEKNCYILDVLTGTNYLIRLMFLGGNFTSGLAEPPKFSVSLENFYWQDIEITDPLTPIIKEVTFIPQTQRLPICFQRGPSASHDPFVSSLELRPLPVSFYQLSLAQIVLTNVVRIDCGLKSGNPSIRYSGDVQDRIWAADPQNLTFPSITNDKAVPDNSLYFDTEAPLKVLQSAWSASRISFMQKLPRNVGQYFILLYFVEIAQVKATDVREIDLYLDDDLQTGASIRVNGSTFATYTFGVSRFIADLQSYAMNVTIVPTKNSTLGAILNAFEIYRFQNYSFEVTTSAADAAAIESIKLSFKLTEYQGDPCLPWAYSWLLCSDPAITGTARVIQLTLSNMNLNSSIPPEIADLAELTDLSLDHNNLTGTIPDLKSLTKLQSLRLQNNNLGGAIPASLGLLPNLTVLTLDNNLFEGGVPSRLMDKIDTGVLTFSAVNNPYLCFGGNLCLQPPSKAPSSAPSTDKGSSNVGLVIGVIAGVIAVFLLLVLLFCWRKYRMNSALKTSEISVAETASAARPPTNRNGPRSFSWAEVTTATKDFSTVLGEGGYGLVYFGKLADGMKVAVKVNKGNTKSGKEQFLNEVALLSRVHHRHLVPFVGCCNEGNHEVLIYAFMSEGTLEGHLRADAAQNLNRVPLDWKTRLEIVLGASKGLEYLHNSCAPPIIHRDIKSANILLTENLVAKISDFGISKPTTEDDRTRGVTTQVKGTFGYLDPEYFKERRLTQKSDVYSFGVVLLEVITGIAPTTTEFRHSPAINILQWVQTSIHDGDIQSIIDPKMGRNYNTESIWKVTELALSSVDQNLSRRPNMLRVVQELTEALEIENRQTSASIVYEPPVNLGPSAYDQSRGQDAHTARDRANSSRSSTESFSTFSTYNLTAR